VQHLNREVRLSRLEEILDATNYSFSPEERYKDQLVSQAVHLSEKVKLRIFLDKDAHRVTQIKYIAEGYKTSKLDIVCTVDNQGYLLCNIMNLINMTLSVISSELEKIGRSMEVRRLMLTAHDQSYKAIKRQGQGSQIN